MIIRLFLFLFILLGVTGLAKNSGALTAKEIVVKSDLKQRGNTSKIIMRMEIIRPDWSRYLELKLWTMGRNYTLAVVTNPAKDKGISFLKRKNELWNWIPTISRTIKISPSLMSQSWMGSDFTNEDLLKESAFVHDYNHTLLEEEIIQEKQVYKIQLLPKDDAAIVWGKVIMWISKDEFNKRKIEYYDEYGELINTMMTFDVREMGGRMIPTRLEMTPHQDEGYKTVMYFKDAVFEIPITENDFSIRNMKKIR
jgi:hypothetical protein